jgi:transposase
VAPGETRRLSRRVALAGVVERRLDPAKAVLVAADPTLRETLSGLSKHDAHPSLRATRDHRTAGRRHRGGLHPAVARSAHSAAERTNPRPRPTDHGHDHRHCPTLLAHRSIGPDNAAALLITAGDNPDRLRSGASFAALCGVSPLEASSGKTTRHRLNRGGDRQANAALYRIALSRLRWDTRTRDYLTRRITEGKTRREAVRCLKRYLAREIYQIITSPPETRPSRA